MTNIYLRQLKIGDKDEVFDLVQNPEVMNFLGPRRALDDTEALEWFEKELKEPSRYVVALLNTDELVGFCGIKHSNEILDFGYFIRERFWGKGIATQSCKLVLEKLRKKVDLNTLEIFISENNLASQRVAEKLGWCKRSSFVKGEESGFLYSAI